MLSQLPAEDLEPESELDEPEPAMPLDADEEETPEKPRAKRSKRDADREAMPPPGEPRPPRAKAARMSSADGALAHAGDEPQPSLEPPASQQLRILRWKPPAPSKAALHQDLIRHGLHEVWPFFACCMACNAEAFACCSRSMCRMHTATPRSAARCAPSLSRCHRSRATSVARIPAAALPPGAMSWQTHPGVRLGQTAPRLLRGGLSACSC